MAAISLFLKKNNNLKSLENSKSIYFCIIFKILLS